jgi:hypothetical protein
MIDMLESTSQCAVDLSISAADVAHSIWLMVRHFIPTAAPHPHISFAPTVLNLALFAFLTLRQVDEGVLALLNGWIVAAANVPFIEHASIPISSISAIAPPSLPLPAPLDIFRFRLGSALQCFESVVSVTL